MCEQWLQFLHKTHSWCTQTAASLHLTYIPSHNVSACFLFCHHFTPNRRATAVSASFLYLQDIWLNYFGSFLHLPSHFIQDLGHILEFLQKLPAAQTCKLGGERGGKFGKPCSTVWCRTLHDNLTEEEILFWIPGSVEWKMYYPGQYSWYIFIHNPYLNLYTEQTHSRGCCCMLLQCCFTLLSSSHPPRTTFSR